MLKWWLFLIIVVLVLVFFLRRRLTRPKLKFLISPSRQATSKLFNRARNYQKIDPKMSATQAQEVIANQLRFDQVAKLLFENRMSQANFEDATQIQQQFLGKMPAQCHSQIEEFDLGEWSIFWNYKQQSLEYYVGRYGIFYTHVDRFGAEHQLKINFS